MLSTLARWPEIGDGECGVGEDVVDGGEEFLSVVVALGSAAMVGATPGVKVVGISLGGEVVMWCVGLTEEGWNTVRDGEIHASPSVDDTGLWSLASALVVEEGLQNIELVWEGAGDATWSSEGTVVDGEGERYGRLQFCVRGARD